MFLKLIGFIVIVVFSSKSYAFDWEACKRDGAGGGASALTSSTQFTSSWGPCSIFGMNMNDEIKLFVAQNTDKLRLNSSQGGGEYLTSFSKLASCDAYTSQKLPDRLQNNLKQIYGDDLQSSAEEVYNRISELVRTDKELSCKYLGS